MTPMSVGNGDLVVVTLHDDVEYTTTWQDFSGEFLVTVQELVDCMLALHYEGKYTCRAVDASVRLVKEDV